MKKLIAALTLLLAFSINAHAQDKGSPLDKGRKQATELSQYLGLDKDTTENLALLFEQKFIVFDDENASKDRKAEISRVIDAKMRATLTAAQIDKLDKNPELLKKILY